MGEQYGQLPLNIIGEGLNTVQWAKGFFNKYATWILAIGFTMVFVKGFGAKIKG